MEMVLEGSILQLMASLLIFFYLDFNIVFNTLCRSYHDGQFYVQRKPVHTVGQTTSNHQLSHLRLSKNLNSDLRGGRQECYHSATVAPATLLKLQMNLIKHFCQYTHIVILN